ncbi:hypothetical protein [Ligilactobacillus ruminis]|uniref:Uncharacterized protein n=2 Tax=Ligilactobacillus ruminis TaxID=1623 RepID=A0A837ISM0_9LACO|nr:hypothetical protein [Ligilactobacillus ruminis]KLA46500.1 hypothetical protein LRB_819 [Ligilactobacillus ruminis]SFG57209.1 hypothetical protein SAMN02910432_01894 [Ligilactobacillus ruminis DSM 20403 = NBRC 102161]
MDVRTSSSQFGTWKNWISIEKFIILANALQQELVSLFKEFIGTYRNENG